MTSKQIADVAIELMWREMTKQRNSFSPETRRLRVNQDAKKPTKQRWEDSARFHWLASGSSVPQPPRRLPLRLASGVEHGLRRGSWYGNVNDWLDFYLGPCLVWRENVFISIK